MKLYKCKMCGKEVSRVHDHHIIPWWFSHDDSDSNIMRVCASCHRKADASFNNLILCGNIHISKDTWKRTSKRYNRNYKIHKSLYYIRLLKYTYYYDALWYNIKTGYITFTHSWNYKHYNPRNRISSNVNIHRRAKNAAVKGQTTLSLN